MLAQYMSGVSSHLTLQRSLVKFKSKKQPLTPLQNLSALDTVTDCLGQVLRLSLVEPCQGYPAILYSTTYASVAAQGA